MLCTSNANQIQIYIIVNIVTCRHQCNMTTEYLHDDSFQNMFHMLRIFHIHTLMLKILFLQFELWLFIWKGYCRSMLSWLKVTMFSDSMKQCCNSLAFKKWSRTKHISSAFLRITSIIHVGHNITMDHCRALVHYIFWRTFHRSGSVPSAQHNSISGTTPIETSDVEAVELNMHSCQDPSPAEAFRNCSQVMLVSPEILTEKLSIWPGYQEIQIGKGFSCFMTNPTVMKLHRSYPGHEQDEHSSDSSLH